MVGWKAALSLAPDLFIWKRGVPPERHLKNWCLLYDQGEFSVTPKTEALVSKKVEAFLKQQHRSMLSEGMDLAKHLFNQIREKGEMKQPSILQGLLAGMNMGMQQGGHVRQAGGSASIGSLNINVGAPRRERVRAPKINVIDAPEVRVLNAGS